MITSQDIWVLRCQIDSEDLAAVVEVKGSCQGVLINLVRGATTQKAADGGRNRQLPLSRGRIITLFLSCYGGFCLLSRRTRSLVGTQTYIL